MGYILSIKIGRKRPRYAPQQIVNPCDAEGRANFRFRSKKWFLTWPKVFGYDLKSAEKRFLECVDNRELIPEFTVEKYIMAYELHKDGTPHIHVAVCFKESSRWGGSRNSKFLDHIFNKHPNISTMRSWPRSLEYLSKDTDFSAKVKCGDGGFRDVNVQKIIKASKDKASTKGQLVVSILDDGGSIEDVRQAFPAYYMSNMRKVNAYADYLLALSKKQNVSKTEEEWRARDPSKKFISKSDIDNLDEVNAAVGRWLNRNIFYPAYCRAKNISFVRVRREKQLWLYGPPGTRKSTLGDKLRQLGIPIYIVPKAEDFHCTLDPKENPVWFFDDLDTVPPTQLSFLQTLFAGNVVSIKRKGLSACCVEGTVVIVNSQCSPDVFVDKNFVMATTEQRDAFVSRFQVVYTGPPMLVRTSEDASRSYPLTVLDKYIHADDMSMFLPKDWEAVSTELGIPM